MGQAPSEAQGTVTERAAIRGAWGRRRARLGPLPWLVLGLVLDARVALAEPALPESVRARQRLFITIGQIGLGLGVLLLGLALADLAIRASAATSPPVRWAIRAAAVLLVAVGVQAIHLPLWVEVLASFLAAGRTM